MKKSILFLMLVSMVFVLSCNNRKKSSPQSASGYSGSFDSAYSVTGREILKEEYNALMLNAVDTFLLASHRNTDKYFFTLYGSKSQQKIMQLMPYGKGPGEFSSGYAYQYAQNEDGIWYVWILDYRRSLLYKVNISKSVEEGKTVVEKIIKTGSRDSFFADIDFNMVFFVDSNKLVGTTSNLSKKMKRFVVYNPIEDTVVKAVDPFPKVNYDFTKKDEGYGRLMYIYNPLFLADFDMKPDKSLFASAMDKFNRLDIFDINGNVVNSYVDDDNITENLINEYLASNLDNFRNVPIKYYYANMDVTDRFIFALYQNRLDSAYKTSIPVKVRVFNWKAEPVCTIDIPDYLQYISIDEDNGILYGTSYYDEKFLKYDIKNIMDKIGE